MGTDGGAAVAGAADPETEPAAAVRRGDTSGRRVAALVWVISFVVTVPAFAYLVSTPDDGLYGYNDHPVHLEQAEGTTLVPLRINSPHPAYHVLVASLSLVLSTGAAATVVLAAATATTVLILYSWARRPSTSGPGLSPRAAGALAFFILFMETPVAALNTFGLLDPPRTFIATHLWMNPTDVTVMPLALLLIQVGVRFMDEEPDRPTRPSRAAVLLLVLTVGVTLAKTAAAIAIVPALFIYLVATGRLTARRLARLLLWCAAPLTAVLLWQSWFLRTSQIAMELGYTDYGVTLDPFRYLPLMGFGPSGPWFFWTPLVPVALAVWVCGRRLFRDPTARLCLASLPLTLFLALFVTETGLDIDGQDLMRPLVFAIVPLMYVSVIAVAQGVARERAGGTLSWRSTPWLVPVVVVAALWLIGGVFLYLDAVGASMPYPTSPPPWPPP